MKKILIVTAFIPSRNAGGTIFTKNLICDLIKDFNLDVFVITTEKCFSKKTKYNYNVFYINKVFVFFKTIFFFPINPLFFRRFSFKLLIKLKYIVKKNKYDLIFFDYSQVFLYSFFFKKENKFLNYHDVIFQKYLREKYPLKLLAIPTFILELVFSRINKAYFITPSEKDSKLLKKYYGQESKFINHYLNDYILELNIPQNIVEKYFVFFGDWSRHENEEGLFWFINNYEIREDSTIKFLIIGKELNAKMRKIVSDSCNFNYMGFVENPYEIIAGAAALIAPVFRGAGIKIKVLESLACGTPVIGSEIAFEGLPQGLGRYLKICKNIEDYKTFINENSIDVKEKQELKEKLFKIYIHNTAGHFIRQYFSQEKI